MWCVHNIQLSSTHTTHKQRIPPHGACRASSRPRAISLATHTSWVLSSEEEPRRTVYLRQLLLRSAPSTDKKISNSYLAHGAARRCTQVESGGTCADLGVQHAPIIASVIIIECIHASSCTIRDVQPAGIGAAQKRLLTASVPDSSIVTTPHFLPNQSITSTLVQVQEDGSTEGHVKLQ